MTRNILYLPILILIISCTQKEPDDYFKSLDFNLDTTNIDLKVIPSPIWFKIIVIPINNNGKKYEIVTDNINGKKIYEDNFKDEFSSYPEFLDELSKGNLYININLIDEFYCSDIDVNKNDHIFTEYKLKGFNYILNKYTLKRSSARWKYYFISNSVTLPPESENSLISLMYKQRYFIDFDDFAGNYHFVKYRK